MNTCPPRQGEKKNDNSHGFTEKQLEEILMEYYNRAGCKNEMKEAPGSFISHGRYFGLRKDIHLKTNGSKSSIYPRDNYRRFTLVSEKCPYEEEQNRTHRKHYGKARETTYRSHVNDTASKEDGPPLNIQITSAFSLNPNMSLGSIQGKMSNYPEPTAFHSEFNGSQSGSRNLTCPILWQRHALIENELPKHSRLKKYSLANQLSHVGEMACANDSRLPNDKLNHGQQIYKKTALCRITEEESRNEVGNKTSVKSKDDAQILENLYSTGPPNQRHIPREKGEPSSSLPLDRYTADPPATIMKPRQEGFETKRGAVERQKEQCRICRDYSTSQFLQIRCIEGKIPSSDAKYQPDIDHPMPLPFTTVKRAEIQEVEESIPVDLNTNEMYLSPCIASDKLRLPTVKGKHDNSDNNTQFNSNTQKRHVTYNGNTRLPWRFRNLSEESIHKFKTTKSEQVKQNDLQCGLLWGFTRQNNKHVPFNENGKGVQGLKKQNLHNARKLKRKYVNTQFLVTPAPETFKNLEMQLALENDEEPIVRIPNYFLDFISENSSSNHPSTLQSVSTSNEIVSAGSPDLDAQSKQVYLPCYKPASRSKHCVVSQDDIYKKITTLNNTMSSEIVTNGTKALDIDKHFPKGQGALNFHEKTCQVRTFQFCSSNDERPGFASIIQNSPPSVFYPQATIKRSQGNTLALTNSDEYQGMNSLEEVPLKNQDRRIAEVSIPAAHNSLKPILNFTGLVLGSRESFQSNDEITRQHVRNAAFERKDTFTTTGAEFPLRSSRNHPIMNEQESSNLKKINIFPELESSKATYSEVGKEFLFRSETHSWKEISDYEMGSTFTETSAVGHSREVSLGERKYQCEVCGRAFSRSNTLITHKRIHTGDRPFPCDLCGRTFRQLGNLTRHKLTHAAIKPHACPKCNKCFSRTSNLNTHMRTHTNYKPFVCDFCGKGFHQKVDMRIHRYTHTGEKPHRCSKCGRGFKQLTHLKYHMRTHSAVRMYNCEHCGKGFNQKGNLQAHIYGHTGIRPYTCDICGKGFTLTSTLNTHKRTHAPNKPFKCEFCEKAFYQKNALKTHYISSHPYTDGVCLL